jgi:hypothetical protein
MQTITEQYRKLQQQLHENPNYGIASLAKLFMALNTITNQEMTLNIWILFNINIHVRTGHPSFSGIAIIRKT